MEKLTQEIIKEFIGTNNIQYLASQEKLCFIINRICRKISGGVKFDDIKICEDLIIDGHHRYLSSLLTCVGIGKVSSQKTSATKAVDWTSVEFDENDWDTPSKISYLNKQDAAYTSHKSKFNAVQWRNMFKSRGIKAKSINRLGNNKLQLNRKEEDLALVF